MFDDPFTRFWVTDDCTININSIYREERLWLQRVDWEWVSQQTVFDDELAHRAPYLNRTREEVEALYAKKVPTTESVKQFLIERIHNDDAFARRCLGLLHGDRLLENDIVALFTMLNPASE